MLTIAITGGIGSGKSLAGKILQEAGYIVIDTDMISRNIYRKGSVCYNKIIKAFGKGVLNKNEEIDRKALADIVFSDKTSLKKLNRITHPEIEKELFKEIEACANEKYVFVLVPLLFESKMQKRFDRIWLVLADKDKRIKRAAARDNTSEENIKKRIENQIEYEKNSTLAHNVLYNNSSEEEFKVQVLNAVNTL
jgi:dephospho-CoA kinase